MIRAQRLKRVFQLNLEHWDDREVRNPATANIATTGGILLDSEPESGFILLCSKKDLTGYGKNNQSEVSIRERRWRIAGRAKKPCSRHQFGF